MSSLALPVEFVMRFRSLALERIDRVESGWQTLVAGQGNPALAAEVQGDLHTLKGEARMMREVGLATLCHALEGLVSAASVHAFRVSEEVDVVVTMALRFMVALLRRKDTGMPAMMDVEGFVRQIDDVLGELKTAGPSAMPPRLTVRPPVLEMPDRVSLATQQRLSALAARVFVEHIAAGRARGRLGDVVRALADEVSSLSAIELAPKLKRHEEAALAVAECLDKPVDLVFEAGDVRARVEVVEALEVVLLHALRNAIDHGVEPVSARLSAGKPERATIRVLARYQGGGITLSIEDDGAGVDLDAVRARAVDLSIWTPERAAYAREDDLTELLFRPGLSTRREVTDLSGRGIGLDAARAAVSRLGGHIALSSRAGNGARLSVFVPEPTRMLAVTCFPARGADVLLAVATGHGARVVPAEGGLPALDPVEIFDMAPPGGARSGEGKRVELRRGEARFALRVGGEPFPAVATRICPTADDCPAEVVLVDGTEVLLIRPENLGG